MRKYHEALLSAIDELDINGKGVGERYAIQWSRGQSLK